MRGLENSAIAFIATFLLTCRCDYRMLRTMHRLSDKIIDDFGGLAELARLVEAPTSTVTSWKKRSISPSRLNHLKLAALASGKMISWDTLEEVEPRKEAA